MKLVNKFSGGTNGTVITTGNSGGASGNAFTSKTGSPTFSSTNATGKRAPMVCTMPAAGSYCDAQYDFTMSGRTVYSRAYMRLTAYPETPEISFTAEAMSVIVTETGIVQLGNYDTEAILLELAEEIPLNQWVRLELRVQYGTTTSNGQAELRLYLTADSETLSDSDSATGINTGTTVTNFAYWKNWVGVAHQIDDLAVSDEGWIGVSQDAGATPGVVTGNWDVPAPAISAGSSTAPETVVGTWTVPHPDVLALEGGAPAHAQPDLITGTWSVPAPTVQAFKNVEVSPNPVTATWSVPQPSVGGSQVPGGQIYKAGQGEWRGLLLGGGTPYSLKTLDGWYSLPDIDSGNVAHPTRSGSYPGRDLGQERYVIWGGTASAPRDQWEDVIDELRLRFGLSSDDTEYPLAIRLLERTWIGYGKVSGRGIPVDPNFKMGRANVTLKWTLSDPRLLSRELANAVVADGATVSLASVGNADARPEIRIPGPAMDPELLIEQYVGDELVGEKLLAFDLTIGSGERLVIDVHLGIASVDGEDVINHLTQTSAPVTDFVFPPGTVDFSYTSAGGSAPAATVLWRHAVE